MTNKPVMLITGTRKGIGKYLAEYYSKNEYLVIGCSRGEIDFELDNYQHFCLDISDESSVKKTFNTVRLGFFNASVTACLPIIKKVVFFMFF